MRRVKFVLPLLLVLVLLSACASQTPWRKATVTSYEVGAIGLAEVKYDADYLLSMDLITAAQHSQVIGLYDKAKAAYITAGGVLKAAVNVDDIIKRDALLEEYDKIITDFKQLAYEINALVAQLRKRK